MGKYKKMWNMLMVSVANASQEEKNEMAYTPDVYKDILADMARMQSEVISREDVHHE